MNLNASISVLMSLYDNENPVFLKSALDSLVRQIRPADQVVIVFDGPVRTELESVVDSFSESLPLFKIKLQSNSGLALALNEGLKYCEGSLVARMDTDDICMNDRLKMQAEFLVSNDLDIVGTAANVIDLDGNISGFRINPGQHVEIIQNLWRNPFIHPSVMFRKSKIQSIGAYDSSLRRRQDYELWFRAAQCGLRLGNLQEKLLEYRFDHHTLKKQSPKLAWKQGVIGFKGSMSCKLGLARALVCFVPFIRSLFPIGAQVKLTQFMKIFDSRTK